MGGDEDSTRQNGVHRAPPLRISWGLISDKNVKQLERLNSVIFPVKYNDHFYKEAVNAPEDFVKLAYFNEVLVAAVCCRKERYQSTHSSPQTTSTSTSSSSSTSTSTPSSPPSAPSAPSAQNTPSVQNTNNKFSLYILTLGVLAPYRERGIGNQLVTHVLDHARTSPLCADVVDVYVHVQVGNDDAVSFYSHHGFKTTETVVGYYKRIEPADCFILRKTITRET